MQITAKEHLLLLIATMLLLGSLASGCDQQSPPASPITPPSNATTNAPGIPFSPASTYTHWGFSISVPSNWGFAEISNTETGGGIIDLYTSGSTFNSLSITASAIEKIGGVPDIAAEAQRQLENAQQVWGSIQLVNNQAMEGNWDWFLSFDSILESTNEEFHTEIYFKATKSHYYILKLSFSEADRGVYPWKEVIETFTTS
jgi:hypothetical protein